MSKYLVMICVDNMGNIVSLDKCCRIIVYDIVSKSIVEVIDMREGFDVDLLEQYIDKHDPYLLITCSSSELKDVVEETGVHVFIVNCPANYTELVKNI